jgi:acyl carrier protein
MFDKVVEIVANGLNISKDKINMNSNLAEDLGADSLDAVDLIMTIEDEFGITVPDEQAQGFTKIADIVSFLEQTI